MADNEFATGYMCGQSENRGGGWGGFDLGGIIALVVIASLFGGYGGFGFGGFGGGAGLQGMATRADINEGFALNNITSGIQSIQNGLCDGFHNQTVATLQGFNGVERGFATLGHQLSDCCCENRAAIADLKYTMATEACATRNLMQTNTRDLIDNQNAGFRAILDRMTQTEINNLRDENHALKFAASQAAQNNYLAALSDAQTAELIRRIAPMPIPSYTVPAPYPFVTTPTTTTPAG